MTHAYKQRLDLVEEELNKLQAAHIADNRTEVTERILRIRAALTSKKWWRHVQTKKIIK